MNICNSLEILAVTKTYNCFARFDNKRCGLSVNNNTFTTLASLTQLIRKKGWAAQLGSSTWELNLGAQQSLAHRHVYIASLA